jgi:mannitol-1-phosphate/altronate dehydrogenase
MEPQTRANQLLPQIATLIGIDLSARIIEELIFKKRAELRSPIVICPCNNLPRQVRVTLALAHTPSDARFSSAAAAG